MEDFFKWMEECPNIKIYNPNGTIKVLNEVLSGCMIEVKMDEKNQKVEKIEINYKGQRVFHYGDLPIDHELNYIIDEEERSGYKIKFRNLKYKGKIIVPRY